MTAEELDKLRAELRLRQKAAMVGAKSPLYITLWRNSTKFQDIMAHIPTIAIIKKWNINVECYLQKVLCFNLMFKVIIVLWFDLLTAAFICLVSYMCVCVFFYLQFVFLFWSCVCFIINDNWECYLQHTVILMIDHICTCHANVVLIMYCSLSDPVIFYSIKFFLRLRRK